MRNWWTRTRIDYHPCITSEPTNQVCYSPQLTFTSSKSTIGALEKGVKYVQSGIIDVVLVFLLLTLNTFHTFF